MVLIMAIINNAHAGSEVSLLCLIYRVIFRNNQKLSVEDLGALCRPENLPINENQKKKFHENLRFWMADEHQLWCKDDNSRLALTKVAASDSPAAISVVTNEALFESRVSDIFGSKENQTEELFVGLGCLLASDKFSLDASRRIDSNELDKFFAENMPKFIPNTNEKPVLRAYGRFLGYLEVDAHGEYVDPTRAVMGVLDELFESIDEMPIADFLRRLAERLPLMDGGAYREQVEDRMTGPFSAEPSSGKISKSLSIAIERLKFMGTVSYSGNSDDPDVKSLQTSTGNKVISFVRYHRDGTKA